MKPARIALLAVALVALAPVTAATASTSAASPRTVSVNGTATLGAPPDEAILAFGVTNNATGAGAALSAANEAMARVIAALKAAGISPKDIQTSGVSLGSRTDDNDRLIGFTASDSVTVVVHAVKDTGAVIDKAVAAGANDVSGPTFTISKSDALYRRALTAALDQAKTKALALAAQAGMHLGKALQISESSSSYPIPVATGGVADAAKASAPTPVEAGQSKIQATVSVTYVIS